MSQLVYFMVQDRTQPQEKMAAPASPAFSPEASGPQPETQTPTPEVSVEVEKIPEAPPQPDRQIQTESAVESFKRKFKKQKPTSIPQVKDTTMVNIEHIMEEDLGDAFGELTPVQKQEFKIKGEEAAWEIRQMLKTGKIKIKQIFKLILEWLKLLPGINKFFLEQEAKIKADKILSLRK